MEPRELIQKTRDFLADPAHWTKYAYCRDQNGHAVDETDAGIVSCCLSGALFHCSEGKGIPFDAAYKIIRDRVLNRGFGGILSFNDAEATTHEDVLTILDEAKELA